MATQKRPRRICRTPEEAWQAGWEDAGAADLPPLTQAQIDKLVPLLRPYLVDREMTAA